MRRAATTALAALLLTSCQPCAIGIKFTGSLEHGVTFRFFDFHNIEVASLSTRDSASQWREIWRVESVGRTFWLPYRGDAPRLEKGRLYNFSVQSKDGLFARCFGSEMFIITTEGLPAECGTDDCIRKFR